RDRERPNTLTQHASRITGPRRYLLPFLDDTLYSLLNRGVANPVFDWLMWRLTNLHRYLWFELVVVALVIWVMWRGGKRGRAWVFCAVMAILIGDGAAHGIKKFLIHRDRPC